MSLTLREVGEARIVSELVIPSLLYKDGRSYINGDDCAVIALEPGSIEAVFTIDCGPRPLYYQHIQTPDLHPQGWLSVLITYTDLLSMASKPAGLLVSLELPNDMIVDKLKELLRGIRDASHRFEIPVVGGNVKDSATLNIVTSGLGSLGKRRPLMRSGLKDGDRVYILGYSGYFIASYLAKFNHNFSSEDQRFDDFYRYPSICDQEFISILNSFNISAAMDSSDGVTACFRDMCQSSKKDIIIASEQLPVYQSVADIAHRESIDPRLLSMSWGSWEFVFSSSDADLPDAVTGMQRNGVPIAHVGQVVPGSGRTWVRSGSSVVELPNTASTRFSATSSFSGGFDSYLALLRGVQLT